MLLRIEYNNAAERFIHYYDGGLFFGCEEFQVNA